MGEATPILEQAQSLLEARGHHPMRIMAVHPPSLKDITEADSILYLVRAAPPAADKLLARTAWLTKDKDRLLVGVERGFPLEPTIELGGK